MLLANTGVQNKLHNSVFATTSTILCFNEHRITQFTWKKAVKMERERERERERLLQVRPGP